MVLVALGMAQQGCTRKETLEVDKNAQSAVDYVLADQEFMSLWAALFRHLCATTSAGGETSYSAGCISLRFESGDTISKNLVRYSIAAQSFSGSLGDGKSREGMVHIELSKPFAHDSSRVKVTLTDYQSQNWRFGCDSMVVTRTGTAGQHIAFSLTLYGGRCENHGNRINYAGKRNLAIYPAGNASLNEPFFSVYGESQGLARTGLAFEVNILRDQLMALSCGYFNSGLSEITTSAFGLAKIDFGDGGCDETATFVHSEKSVVFKLK